MSSSTSSAAPVIGHPIASTERRSRARVHAFLREPSFHFLLLGALIFAAAHVAQRERPASDRRIVVDAQLRQRIVQINRTQNGLTPGPEQLERLVNDYIDDEVMYREAMRLGLDRDDEIVRRRLIQKMQFLRSDLAAAPAPDEKALRAYYDTHPGLFASPSSATVEQLYYSADRGGWAEAEARARRAHDQLEHRITSAAPVDDPFPFEIPPQNLSRLAAARLFGDTPIVDALFEAPEGEWSAPVRSAYGWHLIKPGNRRISSISPFAQMRTQVLSAYLQEQSQAAERRVLEALRARYEIVFPDNRSQGSP
jgi:peptidyl-prolyl cis-trans isomerase C